MKRLAILAALALAGCAHHPEKPALAVAVKCATDPGPRPAFHDTPEAVQAAADVFEQVKLLLAGRAERDARIETLEAANAGCK